MTWLTVLMLLLKLAAYAARRSERYDIERSVLNEIETLHNRHVDDAIAARDSARMPTDGSNPNQRD